MEPNNMEINNATQPKPKKNKLLFIIIIVLAVLVLGIGGYYLYQSMTNKSTDLITSSDVSTTTTTTESPTDTGGVVSAAEISSDMESVNVGELKQAIAELKETLSSFGQ